MVTFLTMTQELVAELGIGGANNGATVPTTVASQTGQLWNAANWIKQAEHNICLMFHDWKFLRVAYSQTLAIGSRAVPVHSGAENVKVWDRGSFWLDKSTSSATQLDYYEWHDFSKNIEPGYSTRSNAKPSSIAFDRAGNGWLDSPADAAYALTAEFYQDPPFLSLDADVTLIPEAFYRLIICEAAIKYGNKEGAIEIIQGMEAEYVYMLYKMMGDQLEGREWERRSTQDQYIEVEIPGYVDD